jgi:glycosyltransferase involved in cell wall biosynthesis
LRVAIEASILALPPSGTATYVRSLSAALRASEPDLDLHLLEPDWQDRDGSRLVDRLRHDRRWRRLSWDAWGSARAARRANPDILHVPQFAAPLWSPCPLVVTLHDAIPFVLPEYRGSRPSRIHARLMQRTTGRAKIVLTPSQAAAADLIRVLGVPAERIRVTPEAADPIYRPDGDPARLAEVRDRFGIGERYAFNVGGLDARKNLPLLVEAFARLLPTLSEPVDLVIAGAAHTDNPALYPSLQPIVDRLGVADRVQLVGRISEEDKLALYRGADLYVTPSRYEGFGLTALEAMSCGVPTIAANRTSLPEVVGDGGLLVEPTVDDLATAMRSVLTDSDLARWLRAKGLEQAATFSWEETARLTLAAYDEVITGRVDR